MEMKPYCGTAQIGNIIIPHMEHYQLELEMRHIHGRQLGRADLLQKKALQEVKIFLTKLKIAHTI